MGKSAAAMLGEHYNKKVVGVNHIYGHIFSLLLERNVASLPFPWVVLTASGGHNEIYHVSYKAESKEQRVELRLEDLEITKL
mgnify:CR=1 FL=1